MKRQVHGRLPGFPFHLLLLAAVLPACSRTPTDPALLSSSVLDRYREPGTLQLVVSTNELVEYWTVGVEIRRLVQYFGHSLSQGESQYKLIISLDSSESLSALYGDWSRPYLSRPSDAERLHTGAVVEGTLRLEGRGPEGIELGFRGSVVTPMVIREDEAWRTKRSDAPVEGAFRKGSMSKLLDLLVVLHGVDPLADIASKEPGGSLLQTLALDRIGALREPAALEFLIRALSNRNSAVVGRAVAALESIGDSSALEPLVLLIATERVSGYDFQDKRLVDAAVAVSGGSRAEIETLIERKKLALEAARAAEAEKAYQSGLAASKDGHHQVAADLFRRACARVVAGACTKLGRAFFFGDGVDQDAATAAEYFRKACDARDSEGCYLLAVSYWNGHGVRKDLRESARLTGHSCSSGYAPGCNLLGLAYYSGEGVPKDLERASRLFRESCSTEIPSACSNLGMLYDEGRGVAQDRKEAVRLFRIGCDGGVRVACERLERLLGGM